MADVVGGAKHRKSPHNKCGWEHFKIVEKSPGCDAGSSVPFQYHETLHSTINYEEAADEAELKRHHLGHHARHEKGVLRMGQAFLPQKQRQYSPQEGIGLYQLKYTFPPPAPKEELRLHMERDGGPKGVGVTSEASVMEENLILQAPKELRLHREERDGGPMRVSVTSEASVMEENSILQIVGDDPPPHQTDWENGILTQGKGIKEADADILMNNENNSISSISNVGIHSADDLTAIGHPFCRSREKFLPPELYALDSCALCYSYIQNRDLFKNRWNIFEDRNHIYVYGNQTYYYNIFNLESKYDDNTTITLDAQITSEELLASFAGEEGRLKWKSCCNAAEDCCSEMLRQTWSDAKWINAVLSRLYGFMESANVAKRHWIQDSYMYMDLQMACQCESAALVVGNRTSLCLFKDVYFSLKRLESYVTPRVSLKRHLGATTNTLVLMFKECGREENSGTDDDNEEEEEEEEQQQRENIRWMKVNVIDKPLKRLLSCGRYLEIRQYRSLAKKKFKQTLLQRNIKSNANLLQKKMKIGMN
ncbi:uncharacterized protein [Palaemon carinicauda]|uniref:uncharacterized protein n=1 Tax=Palaemon carinicauda TaxID=392227 RepID=UPI0035B5894A